MPPKPSAENVGALGYLLNRVAHSLTREFDTAMKPFDLTATQLAVLTSITRFGPTSQSRLAASIGLERQQMVNLVNTLESRGLVRRVPVDRRSWSIEITTAGAKLRDVARSVGADHDQRAFSALTAAQRKELSQLLYALIPQGHFPHLFRDPTTLGND